MPPITTTHTSATARLARPAPSPQPTHDAATNDLIKAFKKFKIKGFKCKKTENRLQPLAAALSTTAPSAASTIHGYLTVDVEKLADKISALAISKPIPKPTRQQAPPAHPYQRSRMTKADKVLSNHGMVKKGTPNELSTRDVIPAYLVKSVANTESIKRINETVALLDSSIASPAIYPDPFNMSNAWLYSALSSPPASPLTIEIPTLMTTPTNNCDLELPVYKTAATVTPEMKAKEFVRPRGKVTTTRTKQATQSNPYTTNKDERKKQKVVKIEPVSKVESQLAKMDKQVAILTRQLSRCEVTTGSSRRAKARKTRSATRTERPDAGYEAENDD